MELKVTTLDGKAAGSVELSDAIFGLEPRADIIQRWCAGSSPSASAGTHKVKDRAEIWRTGKKMYKQKGTGGARHGSARVAAVPRRRPGRSARSCAATPSTCRRRCARWRSSTRCRPRPRTAASSCSTRRSVKDGKTKALRDAASASSASTNALIIDGAEIDAGFATRRAQHPEHRRAAGPGHQRLRHPAPRQAGADQGRGRCAGGAIQMSTKRSAPLRHDPRAGITEKATHGVRAQQGRVQGRARRDQAADQGSGREAVRRQGQERQHADPQGQDQALQAAARQQQSTSSGRS